MVDAAQGPGVWQAPHSGGHDHQAEVEKGKLNMYKHFELDKARTVENFNNIIFQHMAHCSSAWAAVITIIPNLVGWNDLT